MISPRWWKVIRDLWDNKSRTLLGTASIAVGVIAFGGLFNTRVNVTTNLSDQYTRSNPYDILFSLSTFDDELLRWVAHQAHVVEVQGGTAFSVKMLQDGQELDALFQSFTDLDAVHIGSINLVSGQWPGQDEFVLERSHVNNAGLEVGDTVAFKLSDSHEYRLRLVGVVNDISVRPGTFNDRLQTYVTPDTLQRMRLSADYNQLYVQVDRTDGAPGPDDIASTLKDDLERLGVSISSVKVNETREHWATDTVATIITILVVVGSLSLLLSGFLVVNTISGFMAQQKRQIGIQKIIGAQRGQIIALYLTMSLIFGGLALVIALPASIALSRVLSRFLSAFINFDVHVFYFPLYVVALEVGVAFGAPLLSALFPVLGGTQIPPAQAISDYVVRAQSSLIDRMLARIRGLPRPFLMSLRNTFRRKVRLITTLTTLVIAGAFFIAVVNVRAGVQATVVDNQRMSDYDVQVILAGAYDLQGLRQRALAIPEVSAVEGWFTTQVTRVRPDNVQSENITFNGVPADSIFVTPTMMTGHWLEPLSAENRYDVVITDTLLDNESGIELGGTITLRLHGQDQDWRVVGIVDADKRPGEAGVMYAAYDSVAVFGMPDRTGVLMLRTTERTPEVQDQVAEAMAQVLDNLDIDFVNIKTSFDFVETILGASIVIVGLLMVTAVMIALVGGLGLTGTMSCNVLERTREIGVISAVGASTNTLRFMLVSEGVLVGLISMIFALLLSIPVTLGFGTAIGNTFRGAPLTFIYSPVGPVLWLFIILAVSAVASLTPAQRATKISVREAISYE